MSIIYSSTHVAVVSYNPWKTKKKHDLLLLCSCFLLFTVLKMWQLHTTDTWYVYKLPERLIQSKILWPVDAHLVCLLSFGWAEVPALIVLVRYCTDKRHYYLNVWYRRAFDGTEKKEQLTRYLKIWRYLGRIPVWWACIAVVPEQTVGYLGHLISLWRSPSL